MPLSAVADLRAREKRHQVDVLVATLGGNPVPLAITTRCVLRDGGRSVLVHTEETRHLAQRLQRLFTADGFDVRLLSVSAGSPPEIYSGCMKQLPAALDGAGPAVACDYTGGTKAMSVFVYQAVQECTKRLSSAYVDARTNTVRLLALDRPFIDLPVAGQPLLDLSELLALHGWRLDNLCNPKRQPQLPLSAAFLADSFSQAWSRFAGELRQCRKRGSFCRALEDRRPLPDPPAWPREDAGEVLLAIEQEAGLSLGDRFDPYPLVQSGAFGSPTQVCDWIGGMWLESHVLAQLRGCPIAWNDAPRRNLRVCYDGPGSEEVTFELDVVATVGYQLLVVSCTTDRAQAVCKQKLFEVRERARQLGGAEARTVLVCGAAGAAAATIEDQAVSLLGRQNMPLVLGRDAWPHVGQRLAEWLRA